MVRASGAAGRRSGSPGRSLRRRINRLLVAGLSLEVAVVAVVSGSALLTTIADFRAAADRDTEVAAASLLAGMADQQSGLLAYLDRPTEPASLLLYTQGQEETDTALGQLRQGASATARAGEAAAVARDVTSWERWAEAERRRAAAARQPLTDPNAVAVGRQLFSVFRSDQADLAANLESDAATAAWTAQVGAIVRTAAAIAGAAAVAGLLLVLTTRLVMRRGLDRLDDLAAAAADIAAEAPVEIPYEDAGDEVGELAQALRGWREASAIRAILAEQAPVGVCQVDAGGRILTANGALGAMLGRAVPELVGACVWDLLVPEDRPAVREEHDRLVAGAIEHLDAESRWQRREGATVWCSIASASVPAIEGRPRSFVWIVEDVSERRADAERAARTQRRLLPDRRPVLPGYRLEAVCLPSQDVAGDFYDWTGPAGGGFDVTVADVMGKGLGPALVMATLRTALRATPSEIGPGPRVSQLAEAMTGALTDEGLFVTMFHARLELASGRVRYVDAGHGYGAVRRAGGKIVPLRMRNMPLGVEAGEVFEEGEIGLDPGDTLLVYTDGVVEIADRTAGLDEIERLLDGASDAGDMVARLVGRVRGLQSDDVTVVLVQREPFAVSRRGAPSRGPR